MVPAVVLPSVLVDRGGYGLCSSIGVEFVLLASVMPGGDYDRFEDETRTHIDCWSLSDPKPLSASLVNEAYIRQRHVVQVQSMYV
jgi:hypothetical protein